MEANLKNYIRNTTILEEREREVRLHPEYDTNHTYMIRNIPHQELNMLSVTTYIAQFFEKFDPDKILKNWEEKQDPRLQQKTKEQWKHTWKQLGVNAAKLGTHMHAQFENYFKTGDYEIIPEMKPFQEWLEEFNIVPFKSEFTVFSEDMALVGNIDLITQNDDGTYDIWDFKRKAEIKADNYGKYCSHPISHIPDHEKSKYQLQLSIYKRILEKEYGITIKRLWNLCVFGYEVRVIEQRYLHDEMYMLFEN